MSILIGVLAIVTLVEIVHIIHLMNKYYDKVFEDLKDK